MLTDVFVCFFTENNYYSVCGFGGFGSYCFDSGFIFRSEIKTLVSTFQKNIRFGKNGNGVGVMQFDVMQTWSW